MEFDPRTAYQDERIARRYDARRFCSVSGRVFQWVERRALRAALRGVSREGTVLDAPCGTGRILEVLVADGRRVVGADISMEMMAVARERVAAGGRVSFVRMDLAAIPFRDASVDATLTVRFLPHLPPAERLPILRELGRVARGPVILTLARSTAWHRLRRSVKRWLGHGEPVRHPVTDAALAAEFRAAGLQERERWHTAWLLSEQIVVLARAHRPAGAEAAVPAAPEPALAGIEVGAAPFRPGGASVPREGP